MTEMPALESPPVAELRAWYDDIVNRLSDEAVALIEHAPPGKIFQCPTMNFAKILHGIIQRKEIARARARSGLRCVQ
jgi:hypothetical protein